MKKITKPIPVTKTVKVAAPKPAAKAPAPKTAPAAKGAPAKKSAPAKKKPAGSAAPAATYISAKIDIGFGNQLFLRGEGAGLSWDGGLLMECNNDSLWTSTLTGATGPIIFKVLVNDLTWNAGKDYVVEPGQSVTITPTF